jgi:hypothetical protein
MDLNIFKHLKATRNETETQLERKQRRNNSKKFQTLYFHSLRERPIRLEKILTTARKKFR